MEHSKSDQDAGHSLKVIGVKESVPETAQQAGEIAEQTHARVAEVITLAGDSLENLVSLYRNANQFVDGGIKVGIEKALKQKLTTLVTEDGKLNQSTLRLLLSLQGDKINEDGCVTNILYTACKDLDTTMWLWEKFTPGYADKVHPESNGFLRKHLETYGGDEQKLRELQGKFNRGSRRAEYIASYINEIRCHDLLEGLGKAKGDYNKLVQFGETCWNGSGIRDEFNAAVDEVLPPMLETCGKNFGQLIELYSKPLCNRPLVVNAVKTTLLPEITKCGDDFNKLADLRSKTPSAFYDIIDQSVINMCRQDTAKILALTKSPLAKFLCEFVVFNSDVLEAMEPIDIDVIKNLLGLAENQAVKDADVTKALLGMRIKGLMTKYIAVHKENFEKLVELYSITADGEYQKVIGRAVKEAVPSAVDQCAGDFVKLVDLYEKMPEKVRDGVTQIFIDAFWGSSQSLVVYCDHDMEKLCAVRKPAQASNDVVQAIDGTVKEAMKLIMQPMVSQCGDSLDKLGELYKKYEEDSRGELYPWRKQKAVDEVFGAAIENLIPSLLVECEGDLVKLNELYDKIPIHFQCSSCSAEKTVIEAGRKIIEPLIDKCPDDLDELVKLYDGIPFQFRTKLTGGIITKAKNLIPSAIAQCCGNVDKLAELYEKLRHGGFSEELNAAIKGSLQEFINGCGGNFAKQVALYNMISPECQEIMRSLVR